MRQRSVNIAATADAYESQSTTVVRFSVHVAFRPRSGGEVLWLLENWCDASFADVIQQTGFGEPGKRAPHRNEDTCFAAHT
jgi:hypothetical protein